MMTFNRETQSEDWKAKPDSDLGHDPDDYSDVDSTEERRHCVVKICTVTFQFFKRFDHLSGPGAEKS